MIEAEWLASDEPHVMLEFLSSNCSARKIMLYICAGARSQWELLYDDRSRRAVEVLGRAADGQATQDEIESAEYFAESPTFGYDFEPSFVRAFRTNTSEGRSVQRLLDMGVYTEEDLHGEETLGDKATRCRLVNLSHIVYHAFRPIKDRKPREHLLSHLAELDVWPKGKLIREIFANPFRPLELDPAWFAWNDGAIPNLAQTIYGNRAFDCVPHLADALTAAGCTNEDILNHCRSGGEHVRGCWVVDLLLGKE